MQNLLSQSSKITVNRESLECHHHGKLLSVVPFVYIYVMLVKNNDDDDDGDSDDDDDDDVVRGQKHLHFLQTFHISDPRRRCKKIDSAMIFLMHWKLTLTL